MTNGALITRDIVSLQTTADAVKMLPRQQFTETLDLFIKRKTKKNCAKESSLLAKCEALRLTAAPLTPTTNVPSDEGINTAGAEGASNHITA